MKSPIRSEIYTRFQSETIETAKSLAMLASLLDPQYKRLPFLTNEQRKATHEVLEERIDEIPLRIPARDDGN